MRAGMKWIGLIWVIGIGGGGCSRPPDPHPIPTPTQRLPIPPEEGSPAAAQSSITLYFPDPDYVYLVPETRRVPAARTTPRELLEFLAQGPQEEAHEALLPPSLQVQEVTVSEGLATVSFPAHLERDLGAANTALLAIQSIVYTLTERDDVQQVQFLIGGRRLTSFAGALDLSIPQRRDETLIQG